MQMPPVSVLLSWPRPNYKDPVTTGSSDVIITCIFYPLVCVIIGLRCYTRLRISRSFGWDDWLILAAMVPTTAFMIVCLVAEWHYGWNRHIWDIKTESLVPALKIVIASQLLFSTATTLTKISMLALVYRILSQSSNKLPRIIIGVIVLLILECLCFFCTVLFQCGKPSTYWTLSFKPQTECLSETKNLLAAGIINTIGDIIVVILPIPIMWRLKLPVQQQIIVILLFGAGVLVTVASILRTYYLYQVSTSWDKTWHAGSAWTTSSVELYVGISCASIPATKKFFSRYSPSLFGSSGPSRQKFHSVTARTPTPNRHANAFDVELTSSSIQGFTYGKDNVAPVAFPARPRHTPEMDLNPYMAGRLHTINSATSEGSGGRDDAIKADSDDELVGA